MLTDADIAAILKAQCRETKTPSKKLTRSLGLISQVKRDGSTFSFFNKELDSKQMHHAIQPYIKGGLIEETKKAIPGVMKTRYRLTKEYRPVDARLTTAVVMSAKTVDAPEEVHPNVKGIFDYMSDHGECFCDTCLENMDDENVDEADNLSEEQITLMLKGIDDRQVALEARIDARKVIDSKIQTRSKSITKIIDELQEGSRTFKQLLEVSTSKSSLQRSLRQLRAEGIIKEEGAGRSERVYSLV